MKRPDVHLAMLHGFSQNRKVFGAQARFFQDLCAVHLLELKGHGSRADLPGPYGLLEYLEDVIRQLDAAGLDEVVFWGTHTGAGVGLLAACLHPRRIRALVLEAPVIPGALMPGVLAVIDRLKRDTARAGLETALENWCREAPWFAAMRARPQERRWEEHAAIVKELTAAVVSWPQPARPVEDVSGRIREIRLPVLVYVGADDGGDFKEAAERLHRAIPGARSHVFPGLGGFPAWEDPAAVNAVVEAFILSLPG